MPPANSPDSEPSHPPSASFISALAPLNRDVINLAATLSTPADYNNAATRHSRYTADVFDLPDSQDEEEDEEEEEDGDNDDDEDGYTDAAHISLHFLRVAHEERHQLHFNRPHDRLRLLNQQDQRDRLRRSMDRLNRLSDAYGDRVPSQNTLYDWSPAHDDDNNNNDDNDMDAILAGHQPGPDVLRILGREHWGSERRAQGVSQAQRRQHRLSARSRTEALRGTAERERERERERDRERSSHIESRERYPWESSRQMAMQRVAAEARHHPSAAMSLDRERRDVPSRVDAYRRGYLDRASPPASPMLEQTVTYLSHIRYSESTDQSLSYALDAGLFRKNHHSTSSSDFLTDPAAIPPPAPTSWLVPGAVLSGCQHATAARHPDRWPVKVTLHTVDWDTMDLSATMEAYNVPSHTATRISSSSITTFLEGEILDFRKYTLLTESFQSNAANDALYWRKLPPLRDLRDEEVGKCLSSEAWWANTSREWIFMRWKERCFVRPLNASSHSPPQQPTATHSSASMQHSWPTASQQQEPRTHSYHSQVDHVDHVAGDESRASFDDSGCGLTISGFYYICLRRSDGRVEGLYYDPMSSPYQCLELESERGGVVGAWGFR